MSEELSADRLYDPHKYTLSGAVWVDSRTLERINNALRVQIRLEEDREADSSLIIVDSQTVQTTEKGGVWIRLLQATQKQ